MRALKTRMPLKILLLQMKNHPSSPLLPSTNMKLSPKQPVLKIFVLSVTIALTCFLLICHHRPTSLPRKSFHGDLRMRHYYTTYQSYISHQLNKTLNPKLRQIWTTRDWQRKVDVFSQFFQTLKTQKLLFNTSRSLCIGARVGQEVAALRRIGVSDSIGIDLVPYPPLVIQGDFHEQPFENSTFDFEFSNVFDHALFPSKFVSEIERTMKPGGVCVLHVAIERRADKYSANDLFSLTPLIDLFQQSEVVHMKKVDGFGLDTEIAFRKKRKI